MVDDTASRAMPSCQQQVVLAVAQNDISAQEPLSEKSLTRSRCLVEPLDILFTSQNHQTARATQVAAAERTLARRLHYSRLLSSGHKGSSGVANDYLMVASASVGDSGLQRQIAEFSSLEHVRFRVVHLNNGMHGWDYTESQDQAGFPSFLHAVRHIPGHAALIGPPPPRCKRTRVPVPAIRGSMRGIALQRDSFEQPESPSMTSTL
jgi:hypothetical protein